MGWDGLYRPFGWDRFCGVNGNREELNIGKGIEIMSIKKMLSISRVMRITFLSVGCLHGYLLKIAM